MDKLTDNKHTVDRGKVRKVRFWQLVHTYPEKISQVSSPYSQVPCTVTMFLYHLIKRFFFSENTLQHLGYLLTIDLHV